MKSEQHNIGQLCEQFGISPDAARVRWNRHIKPDSGEPFARTTVPTEQQYQILFANSSERKQANKPKSVRLPVSVSSDKIPCVKGLASPPKEAAGQPSIQEQPALSLDDVRDWIVDALLISLAVGHAWLIKYELSESYGAYGQIGGWVVFGFICATVFLSADRGKNITSTYALVFALVIDVAAMWLHYDAFSQFGAPAHITVSVCFFLGGMSWGALFLFRHKKNN